MRRILHLIGILAAVGGALPLTAGESVVLRSGLRLHAERHEVDGDKVRLFANGGLTELPVSAVTGFEADDVVTELPPVPALLPAPVVALPAKGGDSPLELAGLA